MKFRKLGIEIKNQDLFIEDRGKANTETIKKRVVELLNGDEVSRLARSMGMK